MNASPTVTSVTGSAGRGSKRVFARHFGEMLLAMFAGMLVLGGAAEGLLALAGSSMSAQSAAVQVSVMGVSMTVPMVLWMRHRGHNRARNVEMAGSMVVPSAVAAALAVAGVLGETGALTLQHVVMIPAMLGVMMWRYDEYAQHHGQSDSSRPASR